MSDFLPISCWAREDIPSNKIIEASPEWLSNAELLSIIIGTGTDKESSVELSRRILNACNNDLTLLSKKTANSLTHIRGIGKQKAARIMAAMELGRRRMAEKPEERPDLGTATRIYRQMHPIMCDLDVEEFWALYMNQHYKLIKKVRVSHGGITECPVDVRIIMRDAVLSNATILAVCHNHPSGSLTPSRADEELTKSIQKACEVMRIHFMDHVIITDGQYYSFHELGKI
jgi:DNA repair protein RadC